MTDRTFRARLASACRTIASVRGTPTPEVRRLADRAPLLSIPRSEARTLRAVANSREAREASRSQRPYVARSASQRGR
jgi:hypothetical protein